MNKHDYAEENFENAYTSLVQDGSIKRPLPGQTCHFCTVTLNMPVDYLVATCFAEQCPVKLQQRIDDLLARLKEFGI